MLRRPGFGDNDYEFLPRVGSVYSHVSRAASPRIDTHDSIRLSASVSRISHKVPPSQQADDEH